MATPGTSIPKKRIRGTPAADVWVGTKSSHNNRKLNGTG